MQTGGCSSDFGMSDDMVVSALLNTGVGRLAPSVRTFNSQITGSIHRYFRSNDPAALLGIPRMLLLGRQAGFIGLLSNGGGTRRVLAPTVRWTIASNPDGANATVDWGSGALQAEPAASPVQDTYTHYTLNTFTSVDFGAPGPTGAAAPTTPNISLLGNSTPVMGVVLDVTPSGNLKDAGAGVGNVDATPSGALRVRFNVQSAHGVWVGWRGTAYLMTDYLGTRSGLFVSCAQLNRGEALWLPGSLRRPNVTGATQNVPLAGGTGFIVDGATLDLTVQYEQHKLNSTDYSDNQLSGRVRLLLPQDFAVASLCAYVASVDALTPIFEALLEPPAHPQAAVPTNAGGLGMTTHRAPGALPGGGLQTKDSDDEGIVPLQLQRDVDQALNIMAREDSVAEWYALANDLRSELASTLARAVINGRLIPPSPGDVRAIIGEGSADTLNARTMLGTMGF